jgi:hypothetical protein
MYEKVTQPKQKAENPWVQNNPLPPPILSFSRQDSPLKDTPLHDYPLKRTGGVVAGRNSSFRDGDIRLHEEGIILNGKATTSYSPFVFLVLILGFIGLLILLLIVSRRQDRSTNISWQEISEIVVSPNKKEICFVYFDKEQNGLCSLALRYPQEDMYNNIVYAARFYVGDKVREGNIKRPDVFWGMFGIAIVVAFSVDKLLGVLAGR